MKNGVRKMWLQKKPNIMPQDKLMVSTNKKINNKDKRNKIKCPNCP